MRITVGALQAGSPNWHMIWVKLSKSHPTKFMSQGKNVTLERSALVDIQEEAKECCLLSKTPIRLSHKAATKRWVIAEIENVQDCLAPAS